MSHTTFVYNGTSSTSLGIHVEKIIERPLGGLTTSRERLITIPTRDGQWDFGSFADPAKISLQCWIFEETDTRQALNNRLDAIGALLDYRGSGNTPGGGNSHPLVISDQPDRYWNAKYSGPQMSVEYLVQYGGFKLTFICVDPFAHAL